MNRKTKKAEKDEVEELLQAAEDDMLLKLSLDSHHISGASLDADIHRRLQALKVKPKTGGGAATATATSTASKSNSDSTSSIKLEVDDELKAVLGDDLSTRFAALKSSLPMESSSSSTIDALCDPDEDDEDDEDDEVEKLLRWAKDAARLDPSPPSDDDHH